MIRINMLGAADSVQGQGVGSAYTELMRLLEEYGRDDFSLYVNSKTGPCDLIHVHTVDPFSFLKMKFSRKPSVISVHMTPEMAGNSIRIPRFAMFVFQKYLKLVYKSADYVHVVNPDLRDKVLSYGYRKEQIRYIPNFVAKNRFYPVKEDERDKLRAKYHFDKNDFVVFADGQMRAGKGIRDFVEVARMLPECRFIWAGGFSFGPLADGYPDTKEMLKALPANVQFPGLLEREEINELLNACDLFFFPSYEELFPMSILEAASTHVPLLLRDLPEYRNILTGRYMTAESNEEFASAICRIRDNRDLYDKLVKDSESISKQYSEESVYEMWKHFYQSMLAKG